jgi:hypothetical protein
MDREHIFDLSVPENMALFQGVADEVRNDGHDELRRIDRLVQEATKNVLATANVNDRAEKLIAETLRRLPEDVVPKVDRFDIVDWLFEGLHEEALRVAINDTVRNLFIHPADPNVARFECISKDGRQLSLEYTPNELMPSRDATVAEVVKRMPPYVAEDPEWSASWKSVTSHRLEEILIYEQEAAKSRTALEEYLTTCETSERSHRQSDEAALQFHNSADLLRSKKNARKRDRRKRR